MAMLATPANAIICTLHDVIGLATGKNRQLRSKNRNIIEYPAYIATSRQRNLCTSKMIGGIGMAVVVEGVCFGVVVSCLAGRWEGV